ncbi:hypothetical protein LBMAG42_03600 [Deltaproteobacteria bacterium]|nr:hypothetical protein LBMAG42_03600 [Deltaproteobacteria bacterium]
MPPHPALPWTLRSIARLERPGGLRSPRVSEPGFEKWHRIRRNLGWRAFVEVLHADLAESFPTPFGFASWTIDPLADLSEAEAEALVRDASTPDQTDASTFLRAAARGLGLPAGGAFSQLPRPLPRERVLELPGSAGRIAAWHVVGQPGLSFHDQFAFVADTDEERALVGLAAVEARANPPTIYTSDALRRAVKQGVRFDRAMGIRGWAPAEALAAELQLDVRWA